MNSPKNEEMTIVICTNSLENIKKYSLPFATSLGGKYRIEFYLDSKSDVPAKFKFDNISNTHFYRTTFTGLSVIRNIALKNCRSKYILFLDDDVTTSRSSIDKIKSTLKTMKIVGLYLSKPDRINLFNFYITKNQYHYLGLHGESTLNDIWGAAMAFDMNPIISQNLKFNENLGRINGFLISGEDTTFINNLIRNGNKKKLLIVDDCIHNISSYKLRLSYMIKRVFAQGVTEVVRGSKYFGFKKEIYRNFHYKGIGKFILGSFWIFVFTLGVLYGIITRKI